MASCGFGLRNAISPGSGIGLIETIVAPLRFARSSAVSMRGWFVAGFWPITKMVSVSSKSLNTTVDFPTPMLCVIATPEDSWHMFEQSGRLFVPNSRTNSW